MNLRARLARVGFCAVAVTALALATPSPGRAFQGFLSPYFILDFPQQLTDGFIGSQYSAAGNRFIPPANKPVPTATLGSLQNIEILNQLNANASISASVEKILNLGVQGAHRGFKVQCYTGLSLLEPAEPMVLPPSQQDIVTSALYVDTLVLAKADSSDLGASLNASITSVKDLVSSLGALLFGGTPVPAPLPSPVSSLDCSTLGNQSLSDLEVAAGSASSPPATASPSPAPGSGSAAPAPGEPVPGTTSSPGTQPIPSPVATGIQIAINADLKTAAIHLENGKGLIVGASIDTAGPLGPPTVSQTTVTNVTPFVPGVGGGYNLTINTVPNANQKALCVSINANSSDGTVNQTFEYCPPGNHIQFQSAATVPAGYVPPNGLNAPARVLTDVDDTAAFPFPSFKRTQVLLNVSNLSVKFDELSPPESVVGASGTITLATREYRITPRTGFP